MTPEQCYRALGYRPGETATLPQLKQRWKDLCKKCHPDLGGSPEEFRKVTRAYMMLTDAEYRAKETERIRRTTAPNLRGDLDIKVIMPVTFDDAFFGRTCLISFNRQHFSPTFDLLDVTPLDVFSQAVQLAPGALDGSEVQIQGEGHFSNGARGNANVAFLIKPHPKFKLDGQGDIRSDEKIPLDLMVKGGQLDVQTMYGVKRVKVRAGSKPGDTVTLKGCGVLQQCDHVVRLDVHFPTQEELRGAAWAGLKIDFDEAPAADSEADALINAYLQGKNRGTFTFRIG